MKIEKLNDKQIKFVLNRSDLDQRNIQVSELSYGSDKAKAFFSDIMQEAYEKYGFDANNVPLMIEAIPSIDHSDDVTIIVTKIGENKNMNLNTTIKKNKNINKPVNPSPYMIYTFDSLDDVSSLSNRLYNVYFGTNSLYKYKDKYYLILHKNGVHRKSYSHIRSVLSEYGIFNPSNVLSESYLLEHGESIVTTNAIDVLAKFAN